MSPAIAAEVMGMLRQTVEAGSATAAAPAGYAVAGKTGTARRIEAGRYNGHVASFAGIFPADDPQVVVVVKLDNPTGRYYGGQIAAPVFRAAVEAALAASGTAMQPTVLASSGADTETVAVPVLAADEAMLEPEPLPEPDIAPPVAPGPARFDLPVSIAPDTASQAPREVPDTRGRSLRQAAHVLHAAGFRVRIDGSGRVVSSSPPAGAVSERGAVVRIVAEP